MYSNFGLVRGTRLEAGGQSTWEVMETRSRPVAMGWREVVCGGRMQ